MRVSRERACLARGGVDFMSEQVAVEAEAVGASLMEYPQIAIAVGEVFLYPVGCIVGVGIPAEPHREQRAALLVVCAQHSSPRFQYHGSVGGLSDELRVTQRLRVAGRDCRQSHGACVGQRAYQAHSVAVTESPYPSARVLAEIYHGGVRILPDRAVGDVDRIYPPVSRHDDVVFLLSGIAHFDPVWGEAVNTLG